MKAYYGYIRVSTVRQGVHGSSLHEQREAIEHYATRNGLTITEWFEEKETAAKRGRTIFNKMLAALENGKALGVIIHKIDRSARNLKDWSDLGELIDRGIDVHFAHESLDLTSRGGRLAADIQAVVASDYIRNLRDEVRKGFYGRIKQGYYPLPAPLGYLNNGAAKPKTQDPRTAPFVRKAFELYATGEYSLDTLRQELIRLGLKNRRGKSVTRAGLSSLLNNPFYLGLIRIKRSSEYFQGNHEPLVQKELFDLVQAQLRGKRKVTGLRHSYTYQKMLCCKTCGYSLVAEKQKGYVYYRCHTPACPATSLREEALEAGIFWVMRAFKFTDEELERYALEFKRLSENNVESQDSAIQSLRLNISQVEGRLEALTDALVDRLIDKDAYDAKKAKLLLEKAGYAGQIADIESGRKSVARRVQNFLELLNRVSRMDEMENPGEKRDLVKSMTSNLCVSEKYLAITWSFPFSELVNNKIVFCGGPRRASNRTNYQPVTIPPSHRAQFSPNIVFELIHDKSQQDLER